MQKMRTFHSGTGGEMPVLRYQDKKRVVKGRRKADLADHINIQKEEEMIHERNDQADHGRC